MSNVAGIFATQTEANSAYQSLLSNGFTKDDISFLISEDAKTSFFTSKAPKNETIEQGLGGAAAGAGIGALVASLAAVGTIFIPGVNLMVFGPLTAALVGAEAGGIVGGLSGLINADLESDKAPIENALKQGKAVLVVHTESDNERDRARALLGNYATYRKAA